MKKLTLFLLILLFSCNSEDKGVLTATHYPTGELKSEYYIDKKGQKNGEMKYYYKNGQLNFVVNLKNGLFDGKLVSFHPNGKLESVEHYTLNKINGWSIYYDSTGLLKGKEEYVLIYPNMWLIGQN